MAMIQETGHLDAVSFSPYVSESCHENGRSALKDAAAAAATSANPLESFRRRYRLSEPIAANYFTVTHDSFVDGINAFCKTKA